MTTRRRRRHLSTVVSYNVYTLESKEPKFSLHRLNENTFKHILISITAAPALPLRRTCSIASIFGRGRPRRRGLKRSAACG